MAIKTLHAAIAIFAVFQVHALHQSPPRIVKQPPSDELYYQVSRQWNSNDKPLVLECEAEGEPAPKYRWHKNGKQFHWQAYDYRMSQKPGSGTIAIEKQIDEDAGQYQCFAENEQGIATSNSVFVRKAGLNSFKSEMPKTVEANEGEPVTLKCETPKGNPKPNVFWMIQYTDGAIKSINDSRLTIDPDGNLHFSNVTRDDASDDFYYVFAATSQFRDDYKLGNRVLLDVARTSIPPTQLRHQPTLQYASRKNEVALRGKKVELFCIYGGTPLPHINWSKNGRSIDWDDRVKAGNHGKSLVIRNVTFEDAGAYKCEALNGVGNMQSSVINLRVLSEPYFTVEPEIRNAAEDETVEFRCEASGVPMPEIKWIHNGKPIADSEPNPRRIIKTNSIVIKDLEKSDTGNYGCNASNAFGYVYKDVYLNVLSAKPEFIEKPGEVTTVHFGTAVLRCRVFGIPTPQIKWISNGLELSSKYQVQPNGDLIIENVNFDDAGEYTCHAMNKYGDAEASGSLIVKDSTRIVDRPEDSEVTAGDSATFHCYVVADSSVNVKWFRNDEEINFNNEPRFICTTNNSLIIMKTMELDSGIYTCVASTESDKANASAILIVQDVPNAPRLTIVECHVRDAFISWEPLGDNRAPILYYNIEYSTSFTPNNWTVIADKLPATDSTVNVPIISPWTNYTFHVIAVNKVGPSLPSQRSEPCLTPSDVPYKNPDDVKGEGTSPNNLVISWTPMPQIEHNAPGFHYRVSWKRDIPEERWNHVDVYDWKQDSLVIPDQPTFVRYRIKVMAVNHLGESNAAPNEKIGYSGEGRPTEAPSNFEFLQIINDHAALFSWSPVSSESIHGDFKGYKIRTWNEFDKEHTKVTFVKADTTQALVNNLRPDAINYAQVVAYNGRFDSPPSETIEFKTPEGVPSSVQSFEAFPLGSSAFWLRWKPPLHSNGELTGYRVYYEEVNGNITLPKMESEQRFQEPQYVHGKVDGFKPDTTYRLHIVGTTKTGEGEDQFIEKKTSPVGSYKPDRPDFNWERLPSPDDISTIAIDWLPNIKGRPGTHFFVKYRVKGSTYDPHDYGDYKLAENSTYATTDPEPYHDYTILRHLNPKKTYEVIVVSVDGEYMAESKMREIPPNKNRLSTLDSSTGNKNAKNKPIGVCLRKMYNEFGRELYVKHRLKGAKSWSKMDSNNNEFNAGLEPNKVYEVVVTTVDGEYDAADTIIGKPIEEIGMDITDMNFVHFYSVNEIFGDVVKEFLNREQSGDVTAIEVLLENQAYDLSKMREPWPLHEAARKGYIDVVKLLLENGININAEDDNGNTALHMAASSSSPNANRRVFNFLIAHDANQNAVNNKGNTPIEVAEQRG